MGVGLVVVLLLIALMQGVFCKTWNVTMPQRLVGISGSCVTVPCRFEVPDSVEANLLNCSGGGVWMTGTLLTPSILTETIHLRGHVQVVGDLTKKDCTTHFYTIPKEMVFFVLDCPNVKHNFANGVQIAVQQEPSPPQVTSVSQVSEGVQMTLLCSVLVTCSTLPPSVTWLPLPNSMQDQLRIKKNLDGQGVMTTSLTFTATVNHHNRSAVCSVSYPLMRAGRSLTSTATWRINVLYAPRFVVAMLNASCPVPEGRTVMFTCLSDANPPVSLYTWYRADTANLTKKDEGETLVLRVSPEDSGLYLCVAQTKRASQKSKPVSLEVYATAGSGECNVVIPYIICGVVLVLHILTLVVVVYKYQSLSRRLKHIELKGDHTYADLRICSVTSDYDQLQLGQLKAMPSPDAPNYENLEELPSKPISKINQNQSGPAV